MKRALAAWLLASLSAPAWAQGVILENLGDLERVRPAEAARSNLPAQVDLSAEMPKVRGQGPTSACTSFAATYAAGSSALRKRTGDRSLELSPAYTYNLLSQDPWCRTPTAISKTLKLLVEKGALRWEQFAFDAGWCGRKPTPEQAAMAQRNALADWYGFDASAVLAVKAKLAQGHPVIFALETSPSFARLRGDAVLTKVDGPPGEAHALIAVGYDDAKQAVLVQNSWGTGWGANGLGWLGYAYWEQKVKVGYVVE